MSNNFKGRDIISVKDFTKSEIIEILGVAKKLKEQPQPKLLNGYVLGSCFFEPSTRTRLSFETSMLRLGGSVTGFSDPAVTSTKKGETLHDTIKIVGQYVDLIAMRHYLDGAAGRAAEATEVPIINAGDGANQHPSQTLLDLFTIQETQKKLTNLSIAMVGDLKYGRTVHSLAQALCHFGARLYFVAPDSLQMPGHILNELRASKIKYSLHSRLESILPKADIVYMTRIQGERFPDQQEYEKIKDVYVLRAKDLGDVKKTMRILHPLPRVNEIATDVDNTPYAYYFQQAKNGLFIRQALLALVLGKI